MNLITTIDEFKLKYDEDDIFFIVDNKLSAEVLEYYVNNCVKVYWYSISKYQTLSEQFITKYKDKVDWFTISYKQTLTETFIEQHIDKVWWHILFKNHRINLSYEFLVKHLYKFSLYEVSIGISNIDNVNVNKLVEEFPEKYNIDKISYEFNNNN